MGTIDRLVDDAGRPFPALLPMQPVFSIGHVAQPRQPEVSELGARGRSEEDGEDSAGRGPVLRPVGRPRSANRTHAAKRCQIAGGMSTTISLSVFNEVFTRLRQLFDYCKKTALIWDDFDPCLPCTTHIHLDGVARVIMREVNTCACGIDE